MAPSSASGTFRSLAPTSKKGPAGDVPAASAAAGVPAAGNAGAASSESRPGIAADRAPTAAAAAHCRAVPGWTAASALARLLIAAVPAAGVLALAAWALAGI